VHLAARSDKTVLIGLHNVQIVDLTLGDLARTDRRQAAVIRHGDRGNVLPERSSRGRQHCIVEVLPDAGRTWC